MGSREAKDSETAGLAKEREFFLAGGTGLALHLGHRSSRDLDWFSKRSFDSGQLGQAIQALPDKATSLKPGGANTLRAYYGELETSFIHYGQVPNLSVQELMVDGVALPVATIETLAVMKAGAVLNRGSKRDFVDIYAICKLPQWSLDGFIELATRRLPVSVAQLELALSYFGDAERDLMSSMCTFVWNEVKDYFLAELRKRQVSKR